MRSITYTSDNGRSIQFNGWLPYYLSEIDLNSVGSNFDEYKPIGYDGSKVQGESYNAKPILASGIIVSTSKQNLSQMRQNLAETMSIHYEGWLSVTLLNGKTWKIRARPTQNPTFQKPVGLGQPFSLEWRCDSPYWLKDPQTVVKIGQIEGLWRFPFHAPVVFGQAVGNVEVLNSSVEEVPVTIEILSQATKILITNETNGQTLEVAELIAEGQKMVLDSNTCDISIVDIYSGAHKDATNKLVAGSQFITLAPGKNKIVLDNGIPDSIPLAYIRFYEHSLGV